MLGSQLALDRRDLAGEFVSLFPRVGDEPAVIAVNRRSFSLVMGERTLSACCGGKTLLKNWATALDRGQALLGFI